MKPERIEKILGSQSKIEGAAGNLRGALFEVVVGHMVRSIEGGPIDIGAIVRGANSGARAEIDGHLVYECKGHQSSARASKGEVEVWLTKKVPIIASAHSQPVQGGRLRFEF